jgi:hypothetical protein
LKHIAEVMSETSIPRQHIQICFRWNGYVEVVHTATIDRYAKRKPLETMISLYGSTKTYLRERTDHTEYRRQKSREIWVYWRVLPSSRSPATCSPNSYKEVEVLKTLCVIVPVTFRSVQVFVYPPGDCPINRLIHPESPLSTFRVNQDTWQYEGRYNFTYIIIFF